MTPAKVKETYINDYCHSKGYQVVKTEVANGIKLEISNLSEKIPVTIFDTGKMLPQGSPKSLLFQEFQKLKTDLEQNPDLLKNTGTTLIKSCNQKYEIIITELQNAIKDELNTLKYEVDLQTNSNANEIYRAKIQNNNMNLSLIQYKSGTLLLQGKQNSLFDDICSMIEKIAKPTDREIVVRFIADNSNALDSFNATFNPDLQSRAEENIKINIGIDAFNFLEDHDKKYLVASECLRLCKVPLPEFSPIVMPASKSFEGFTKKMVIGLGIEDAAYFQYKNANFARLKDKTQPRTKAVIEKERYAETFLSRLILSLDMFRNFMLHSDDSSVTKINSFTEADSKLDELLKEFKEIYDYFHSNTIFGI
jgi:hypothetical protein